MWQPIETATAVGKKKLLFALTRGGYGVGHRVAGTDVVRLDHAATNPFKATHWTAITPPEAK